MKFPPRIGFIGIGIMGSAMAGNLIKAGYKIKIYNRTREKCYPLEKEGAEIAISVKELSKASNVVITMLENEKAMDDILYGSNGVIENLDGMSYLINMSTVGLKYTKKLHFDCLKKGIRFLDSPVSGSKTLAENKSLIILSSGEKEDVDYLKPILLAMGKDVIYCGRAGNGTILKLSINLLLAAMTSGIVESFNLIKSSGLNPSLLFEVIDKSPVLNCGYYRLKEKKLIEDEYSTQFSLKNMLKDLKLAMELARDNKMELKLGKGVLSIFEEGFKKGYYNEDLIAISKLYR